MYKTKQFSIEENFIINNSVLVFEDRTGMHTYKFVIPIFHLIFSSKIA